MGAVGSFQRIQEFLGTEVRIDSRRVPNAMDFLLNHDHQFPKKNSVSEVTVSADTGTEKSDPVTTPQENYPLSTFDAIVIQNGNFGWDKESEPLLRSINMVVPREKITMVVGPVGCGKSTLTKALLGEVATLGGSVELSSSDIAFCDQTPWHMNGTVRESIIGMSTFEEVWYSTVIRACALEDDLQQLSRGDQTQIGSNGISLSGGQSQRIVSVQSQSNIAV